MKKLLAYFLLFCFSVLFLSSCKKQAAPPYNLATGIQVTCQHKDVLIQRNYTSQKKMKAVLTYLRILKPRGLAEENPVSLNKEIYQIRVQLPNGKLHIYEQTAHRFFKGHGRPWRQIAPETATQLYEILARYESDPFVAVITSGDDL